MERYARQVVLPAIGLEGQQKFAETKTLVVGAGGIGSTVCMYLVNAGISITIVDFDICELSNLHR